MFKKFILKTTAQKMLIITPMRVSIVKILNCKTGALDRVQNLTLIYVGKMFKFSSQEPLHHKS